MSVFRVATALAVALSAGSVHAQPSATPPRVAVIVQVRVNASEMEGKLLVGGLERALAQQLRVSVVPQQQVSASIGAVPTDCLSKTSCVQELVAKLDVEDILSLVIVRIGEDFQIDATWIDGDSGGLKTRPQIRVAANAGDFVSAFSPFATELLPHRDRAATPSTPQSHISSWILGGIGVAALATGATLGVMAKGRFDDCKDEFCSRGRIDSINSLELGADLGFAVALLAGGAAVGLWLFGDTDESASVGLAPTVGGAAAVVRGRF